MSDNEIEREWIFSSLNEMIKFLINNQSSLSFDEKNKFQTTLQEKEKLLKDNIEEGKATAVKPLEKKINQLKKQKLNKIKNVFLKIFTLGFYNREKQIDKKIEKLKEKKLK